MAKCANPHGRKLMRRFEAAVQAYAFRGAQHPLDVPILEREYEDAKKALQDYLDGSIAK